MTEDELFDALDGLKAYDGGCTDSGIHDEALRGRVRAHLLALPSDVGYGSFSAVMGRFLVKAYLGDEAVVDGYGYEDVESFVMWMRETMEIQTA